MKLDGKKITEEIAQDLLPQTSGLKLALVWVGGDSRSQLYINRKKIFGKNIGVSIHTFNLNQNSTPQEIISEIEVLGRVYDGVMVQLPIPSFSEEETQKVLSTIPPNKDVDCLNPKQRNGLLPPVAGAVQVLIEKAGVDLHSTDQRILIVGQGKTVGLPVAQMFTDMKIKYEAVDRDTDPAIMRAKMQSADIIVSGAGVPKLITPDKIKEGVVLVDAGIGFIDGKLYGDVDPACYEKASYYSPVPGGVGPVGIAVLFQNLLKLSEKKNSEMVQ